LLETDALTFHIPAFSHLLLEGLRRDARHPPQCPTWRIPTFGIFAPDCALAAGGAARMPTVSVTISASTDRIILSPPASVIV
jgi:hypothetical protein